MITINIPQFISMCLGCIGLGVSISNLLFIHTMYKDEIKERRRKDGR